MFRAARWRGDRGKVKAVFKLQFQATQVPEVGWEAMMVVVTPQDVGRPTARSERAAVAGGACRWPRPIIETTKLAAAGGGGGGGGARGDKIYQFLVYETGSNKAALLGEASLNLADYANAFKPAAVVLPLNGSSGALLHVTIQRVVGGSDEGRDRAATGDAAVAAKPLRRTLQSQLSSFEEEDGERGRVADGTASMQDGSVMSKQPPMKFPSSRNIPVSMEQGGNLHKCNSFDAISASGSDGSSGRLTPMAGGVMQSSFVQDTTSTPSPFANGGTPKNLLSSSGDWSGSSVPDASTDGSTTNSGEAAAGLRGAAQESEDNVEKLRGEITALTRKLDVSEMELQTLRKQIVKESRRGQDLAKEMGSLREERDALRRECEELRSAKKATHDANGSSKRLSDGEDPWSQIEELKQELSHEKNLNADLRLQLQKMQESNSELVLAVKDLDEMLEQKNREIWALRDETRQDLQEVEYENALSNVHSSGHKIDLSETSSEHEHEDQYALDALVKKNNGMAGTSELEKKIVELSSDIELYKKDREDLEMQMEQLALDYEIMKQENHDISSRLEQMQLREQLRMQYECSAHLAAISDLENNVESLENELQAQAEAFEADLAGVMCAKVEQEQRAIKAEEALRKARWNNANAAEHLQEEFKVLSSQVSSVFDANERLLVQARKEASELRLQKSQLEELLQKAQEELGSVQEQHRVRIQQLLALVDFKSKETDRLVMEFRNKSDEFQSQKRSDEVKLSALSEEINQLKAQLEKLSKERDDLSEQKEQKEKALAASSEKDMLLQDKTAEMNALEKEIASLKEQLNAHLEELNDLKHMKNEKEATTGTLKSEIESVRVQYDELKCSLSTNESEKENLAMEVLKLRRALADKKGIHQTMCNASSTTENGDATASTRRPDTNGECSEHGIRNLGVQADQLVNELNALKERNKSMEDELKEMQERYSELSLKFAEVEGERQQLVMTVRTLKNAMR